MVVAIFLDVGFVRPIPFHILDHLYEHEDGDDTWCLHPFVLWIHADCCVLLLHAHRCSGLHCLLPFCSLNLWSCQGGVICFRCTPAHERRTTRIFGAFVSLDTLARCILLECRFQEFTSGNMFA